MLELPLRRRPAPETLFGPLFEAAPEALALLDGAGRILVANTALARLAGAAVALRPGLPVAQLLAIEARPALVALLAAAAATTVPCAALRATPVAAADAEWELVARPIAGPSTRILLRVADRTEARATETRLREASRLETVGRLAGGIAHDFNNLLTAILGAAEAASAAGVPAPAALELEQIEGAARRGAELVAQLLAFARQQRLSPRVIEVNAAVAAMAPILRRLLGPRIAVELALEEPGRRIEVDPVQLDQVVLNLAANAGQAMPEGGVLRLATGARMLLEPVGRIPPGRYAVLEVADTGAGMPPEVQARIFEPFFTTRPDRGGTGLGLATVQGIVAQSGGHIEVESRVGAGTVFRVLFPRHEGLATVLVAAAPPPPAPIPASPAPGGAPVLLVEDEALVRRLAEQVLRRAGHPLLVADCAEAALDLVADGPAPAALVTDVAMPGMDGLALARALRARFPGMPALLLSGYAEVALGADLATEGLRFLAKPYTPAGLRDAVAALVTPAA